MVECPGDGVIRNRARCRQGDHWVDCYRDTCCPGYTLIVNRCIPDNEVKQGSNKSTSALSISKPNYSTSTGTNQCSTKWFTRLWEEISFCSYLQMSDGRNSLQSTVALFTLWNLLCCVVKKYNAISPLFTTIFFTQDPCSEKYGLCEQHCSTYFGRVVCTCFSGYTFNKTRHQIGLLPTCQDIDECIQENGGCSQTCVNTFGGFK